MPIEVTVDLSPLDAIQAKAEGLKEQFVEKVMRDTEPEVPVRTGHLRDSATVTGNDEFTYTEHYADYVYNGTSRQKANPWFERAKAQHQGDWEQWAASQILGGQ